MGNVGRIFCVALPFILTVMSIIMMLVVGLAGVTSNSLYIFQVNTTDLSISENTLNKLIAEATKTKRDLASQASDLMSSSTADAGSAMESAKATLTDSGGNITAKDLGLGDLYDITLWGYCRTGQDGQRSCTKAQYDWADQKLNESYISTLGQAYGVNITLPDTITESLNAFKVVTKWTEIVYVLGMIALAVELFFGFFTACSRVISCVTWIASAIATVFVVAFAIMVTALASIVIGAVEGTAKAYGATGSINTSFLAVAWIGAAFAIAAGAFWLFTVCCCKPDRSRKSRSGKHQSAEKLLPTGGYAPLHDNRNSGYSQHQGPAPAHHHEGQYAYPSQQQKYEPYSHSRV